MDTYYMELRRELVISNPVSHVEEASRCQITFNFSCKHVYRRWIAPQDSTELHSVGELESLTETESMRYDVQRIDSRRKFIFRAAVFGGLEAFSLSYLERQEFSRVASNIAWHLLAASSPNPRSRHHLRLDLDLIVVHDLVSDERLLVDWTSQQDTEAAMVPATDACLESLQSETIGYSNENHGSCVVCLEDFEAGCESVVSMPCSHIFHGECIKNWLRTSHYCPVCRYEMPTE